MSRRAVIEEVEDEEFNDDTDLPLPRLPNTGGHGPLLQELDLTEPPSRPSGPPLSSRPQNQQQQSQGETSASGEKITVDPVTGKKTIWIKDSTAYKMWTTVYPIYFDAKRAYGGSERRIAREKCIWWPLSDDIVDACARLEFQTLHEPVKQHPRDWENPGRVKVCFKLENRLQNPNIKTKKQLLEAIALNIQLHHPDLVPRSPADTNNTSNNTTTTTATTTTTTTIPRPTSPSPPSMLGPESTKPSPTKKEKAKTSSILPRTTAAAAAAPIRTPKSKNRRLPQPPPGGSGSGAGANAGAGGASAVTRVSQFSPAQETHVLIETVKAGMNAPVPGEGSSGGPAAVGGKGKRKVLRVR